MRRMLQQDPSSASPGHQDAQESDRLRALRTYPRGCRDPYRKISESIIKSSCKEEAPLERTGLFYFSRARLPICFLSRLSESILFRMISRVLSSISFFLLMISTPSGVKSVFENQITAHSFCSSSRRISHSLFAIASRPFPFQ